jgi:hypothetical protein
MSRAVPFLAALVALLALAVAVAAPSSAVPACPQRADEVRFDDGRLLVERSVRDVDPRNVRERWWTCWRPTGRRALVADVHHGADRDELSLLTVRRGRFVLLSGAGRLDVHDARSGRLTATLPQRGTVRQLVVTPRGRAAALQDVGAGQRLLYGGSGARGCLLDAGSAGAPDGPDATVFGDLSVHRERLEWHRDGVTFGADLARLDCTSSG